MNYDQIIKNVNIYGLEESIRGAKFPMATDTDVLTTELTTGIKKLAMSPKGEGHDTWLNGVIVQFDLTFTVKAWTEAERYSFLNFVSSESTMHRITRFDLDKSYIDYVDSEIVSIMKRKVKQYNDIQKYLSEHESELTFGDAQQIREEQTERYLQILYSNPCGMKLTARMTTNYRQLKTIYAQRHNHRLPEWRAFCEWLTTLPHSEFITGKEEV